MCLCLFFFFCFSSSIQAFHTFQFQYYCSFVLFCLTFFNLSLSDFHTTVACPLPSSLRSTSVRNESAFFVHFKPAIGRLLNSLVLSNRLSAFGDKVSHQTRPCSSFDELANTIDFEITRFSPFSAAFWPPPPKDTFGQILWRPRHVCGRSTKQLSSTRLRTCLSLCSIRIHILPFFSICPKQHSPKPPLSLLLFHQLCTHTPITN